VWFFVDLQLHLHVGTLVAGVKTALQAGYKWANSQQPAKSKFLIACAKPGTDITCKFDASKQLTSQNTISVDIAAGATPSVVKPFETVSSVITHVGSLGNDRPGCVIIIYV
jgi:hypothetical protein